MNLIGEVEGKIAIFIDDMIDTAGTITNGADAIAARGAKEVYACCSHAVSIMSSIKYSDFFLQLLQLGS